ncbi:MAG: tetratricopeptide repeat protein [Deltaproteobacteria bacterium]|nr:tetratricopeptide repeat protein [Deltaproteobacteria bacterium]
MTADLQSQIEHFNALIAEGAPAHVYSKLAEAYRRSGRHEDAAQTARTGLERHPGSLAIQEALGLTLLDMGQAEPAVRALAPVVEKLPDNSVASISLAIALSRIGRVDDAMSVLRRRLDKDPLDRPAMNLLRRLETKGASESIEVPAPPVGPVLAAAPKPAQSVPAATGAPQPTASAPSLAPTTPTDESAASKTPPPGPAPEPEIELPIPDAPVRPEMEFVVRPLAEVFRGLAADDTAVETPEGLDGFFDEAPRPLQPIPILDQNETSTTWTMSATNGHTQIATEPPASPVPEARASDTPLEPPANAASAAVQVAVNVPGDETAVVKKRGWWSRFWRWLFRRGT